MRRITAIYILLTTAATIFLSACGASAQAVTPVSVGPLDLPDFSKWSAEDVCKVLSTDTVEEIMGRKLQSVPQPFDDSTYLGKGCAYDAGKTGTDAYFGYIALAPRSLYEDNRRVGSNVMDIRDFGLESFRADGADAEQFWVKLSDEYALVTGIGDKPNLYTARLLAKTFLEKIGSNQ